MQLHSNYLQIEQCILHAFSGWKNSPLDTLNPLHLPPFQHNFRAVEQRLIFSKFEEKNIKKYDIFLKEDLTHD